MKISRSMLYLLGSFVLAFVMITVLKIWQAPQDIAPVNEMSGIQKAKIAQFWKVYNQASALRRSSDFDGAAMAYRKALHLNNRHEDTLYYLGNTLFHLKRYDEALSVFHQLVKVNPLSSRAHFQIGAVLSCAEPEAPFDLDAAEQAFHKTIDINREESEPLVRLGEIAVAKGAYEQAETHLTNVIRMNQKAVAAYYLLGYIYWHQGKQSTAIDLFKTAYKHGQVVHSAQDLPGEGDIRDGKQLGEGRLSLFTPFIKKVMATPKGYSDIQIDNGYRQFKQFHNEVLERWQKTQK